MAKILILLLSMLFAYPIAAGDADAPLTKAQGDAIIGELKAIRLLLEKQAVARSAARKPKAPVYVEVSIANHPFMGDENAPVTLVEFTDYQCPFCRKFHVNTFPQIKKDYIDTGKVKYVAMDLPLGFHANAQSAANAALCARDQGKFWELRHVMIMNASKLGAEDINGYARGLGIEMPSFERCLKSKPHQPVIDADIAAARKVGITGTPTFVIVSGGKVTGDSKVKGLKQVGAQPYPSFKRLLETALKKPSDPGVKSVENKQQQNAGVLMTGKKYQLKGSVEQDGK